jgi:hydrophobic/amphiphilic exporter-1 (mainly G- bacteria), HAE1 family
MFTKILYRPALAIVISIVIVFMGVLGYISLPRSQFPSIAPPTVLVFITYPGASAEVLVDSTLIPLERAINGVQGMRYMSSDATSAGEATIRIYFEPGTDPDLAVVNVQNRIAIVKNLLPPLVQREGIIVSQVMPSMLMYVNVFSKAEGVDQKFLYNYTNNRILQELRRVKGIGAATILGSRTYAMRIWLNPEEMQKRQISTDDVMKALAEQSVIGSPGRLGQASGINSQSIEYVLTYPGRYNKPEQYGNIILKATPEGEILRLSDICKIKDDKGQPRPGIELGSEFFDIYSDVDGHPSAAVIIKQNPGSNAADVIAEVKKELERIKADEFPPGMDYEVTYDVSAFLEASIEQVKHTLIEAFILVSVVVFLFLGDWRSTLIPILAVPVSLIGTFFLLQTLGLSINLITLFALVLAIGVVVDDAIVVVEAVHAKMIEKHLMPYRATMEVLQEISGAIVAITLVMTAVFIPVTFVPGPVGTFYRQFGITMATAIVLSGVVALTLTPVLCAMILKPHQAHPKKRSWAKFLFSSVVALAVIAAFCYLAFELWGPFGLLLGAVPLIRRPFDWLVVKVTNGYAGILRNIATLRPLTILIVGGFCAGIFFVNKKLPTGFIPNEDQGILYGIIQTPPGSTLEYTNAKSHELQAIAKGLEEVTSVSSLAGYEILTEGRGSNAGTCIINLKPWNQRKRTSREIIETLEERCKEISDVNLEFFEPPAVPGFGAAGGFSLRLLDKNSTTDYKRLGEINDQFMDALKKRKELTNLFTFYTSNYPQLELVIDNDIAMQKGVSIGKALDNLNILIGSTYEQGFILFGQFYKVYVQAGPEFRSKPKDLENLFVKNEKGEMVPYSAFMTVRKKQGLNEITRYNLYPSATIQGAPAPGYSSGQALKAIQEVAKDTLPRGYGLGWEGLSYDEAKQGNEAVYIFLIVVAFVYLVLVAQYESFFLPLAVIVSLPVGVFGSFLFLYLTGLSNDVYTQIGLVMLVGLLGKNAILIVEFAVQRRREGVTLREAAVDGGKLRFRPIQMTSFAFIVGLAPLVIATGAGAIGNRTIGTTAAGGMLIGTLFGVLIIPGLYYIFGKMADGRKLLNDETDQPLSEIFETRLPHGTSTPPLEPKPAETQIPTVKPPQNH